MNVPFCSMTNAQLAYSLPLSIAEVWKSDASVYPPATLRQLRLALQKYLEIDGRVKKFLSDISNTRFAILTHIY